jgi:DNA helicase TIP49 (TBP-interacting protein)
VGAGQTAAVDAGAVVVEVGAVAVVGEGGDAQRSEESVDVRLVVPHPRGPELDRDEVRRVWTTSDLE